MKTNIIIEPLSSNRAWKGRRFKSEAYDNFEKTMLVMLPRMTLGKPPYHIHYTFGFSNKASDIDNPVKSCTDILQKKYLFDDKLVYKMTIEKVIVPKGREFVEFEIFSI